VHIERSKAAVHAAKKAGYYISLDARLYSESLSVSGHSSRTELV
jgi:hypothetical protein